VISYLSQKLISSFYKAKKKIINPDKNWDLSSKPINNKEWDDKQKDLYL
jgi:hypothetical protein